jgi:uncharacterized protein YdeI (YjbR/CyaY-like superfamily)
MPVVRPSADDVHIFPTAHAFRAWLAEHHASADALFVGYYKKGVPKQAMTYPQAVEEALCVGWIDGITYRIDDELTATRFTPRRKGSNWSGVNIAKVAELTEAGRMHEAGLRAFDSRDRRKDASYSYERPAFELESAMLARLSSDGAAFARWQAEPPSFRRTTTHWVMSAKRAETRERRFGDLLEALRDGRRPKPFIIERPRERDRK